VLLMWLASCALTALLAGLAAANGQWLPAVAAIVAAQAAVLAGNAVRMSAWATWPAAIACATIAAFSFHGTHLAAYVVLVGILLLVARSFARLAGDLSAFCLSEGDVATARTLRTTTLADPVAREFARARRDASHLAVVSIALPETRGAARRLARIARELVPSLRRTDAIVRAITGRLVVVLPGGDNEVATAVLDRALVTAPDEVLVGTASFPEDGPTCQALKDVAQARERPWPRAWVAVDTSGTARGVPRGERVRS
jgi:hypothetical protein